MGFKDVFVVLLLYECLVKIGWGSSINAGVIPKFPVKDLTYIFYSDTHINDKHKFGIQYLTDF